MLHQTKPCPNCGELGGWRETWVVTYDQTYTAEGEGDDISEYVHVEGRSRGKRKICARCYHPITSFVKEATA